MLQSCNVINDQIYCKARKIFLEVSQNFATIEYDSAITKIHQETLFRLSHVTILRLYYEKKRKTLQQLFSLEVSDFIYSSIFSNQPILANLR